MRVLSCLWNLRIKFIYNYLLLLFFSKDWQSTSQGTWSNISFFIQCNKNFIAKMVLKCLFWKINLLQFLQIAIWKLGVQCQSYLKYLLYNKEYNFRSNFLAILKISSLLCFYSIFDSVTKNNAYNIHFVKNLFLEFLKGETCH